MKNFYLVSILIQICLGSELMAQIPGSRLFDNSKIHEIKIVSLRENLRDTLEANYILSYGINQMQTRDIPYTSAKLIVDGTPLDTLGIRYKGFNSWWHSVKKPIKIDINKYKRDQEFDGLKKFNLHNGSGDPSFIRENISYKLLRTLGIKVPRTAYAKVFVDDDYIGLYRIVEQVDNTFLDVNFGNHDGNLYKQQSKNTSGFSMTWRGADQESYYESVSLENHDNKNDWSGFIHFLDLLNNSTDEEFRNAILTVFDVDEYLQVLAFDVAVNNLDYYGNSGRNFYLYNNNGKFHWLPWDYNLSWMAGDSPLNIDPSSYSVLIRRILEVPEFYNSFLTKYCSLKPLLSAGFIDEQVRDEAAFISSDLENDPYEDYPFEAFQKNTDMAWRQTPGLLPFAAKQYAEISDMLEVQKIDCDPTGIVPSYNSSVLSVYPVPANDWVTIELSSGKQLTISMFNGCGQFVREVVFFRKGKLNVSDLPSGFYLVQVNDGKTIYSKFLLISH